MRQGVIRTWDLSLCLYLNLKHDDLDLSATMTSSALLLFLFLRIGIVHQMSFKYIVYTLLKNSSY